MINSCDGSRRQIRELADLFRLPDDQGDPSSDQGELAGNAPLPTSMAINLRDRVSDLEQSLFEERRALQECEARYQQLKGRFNELLQK